MDFDKGLNLDNELAGIICENCNHTGCSDEDMAKCRKIASMMKDIKFLIRESLPKKDKIPTDKSKHSSQSFRAEIRNEVIDEMLKIFK